MQFIDLASQYKHLKERIDSRIQAVLDHGNYIMGPEVFELEAKLAEFVGVKHCITCANGTDALQLALLAYNIKQGDAVFCPTFTFFATAEVIAYAGSQPVFVDSDPKTFNMCPEDLENRILSVIKEGKFKPRAIIAVDLFGLPADYVKIQAIADKYNMFLIEDAAQGFGGNIGGKKAGSFGDIATTSFFPAKPLGCYGDGGAIFTNNHEIAELLKSLRVHGKGEDKYDNQRIGVNSRLDTIQAAILLAKLEEFPTELLKRNKVALSYNEKYKYNYKIPFIPETYFSSWAQYTIVTENREKAIEYFNNIGVPTMVYYPRCMHQQAAFSYLNYTDEDFPVASLLAKQVLSLPMHPYLDV